MTHETQCQKMEILVDIKWILDTVANYVCVYIL